MPLISFTKSRSPKSEPPTSTAVSSQAFGGNGQRIFAGASTSSFHVNTSSATSFSGSPLGNRSLGRTKDRFSKAFTFSLESFNIASSIRGRSKPISNVSNNVSSRSISQSFTTYTGYEDEDYGEPDIEAEEIRPPSGLGRRATSSEFNAGIINSSKSSTASHFREPRTSESSDDGDSLVEIRYPSGLGDIKLTVTPVSMTKGKLPARSTYPDFYLQCPSSQTNISLNKCGRGFAQTTSFPLSSTVPAHFVVNQRSFSAKLCKLLAVLGPYLDASTLCTLTLVSRTVGLEARKLLWCRGHMALRFIFTESSTSALLDGQKATAFLDFLSKKDVSHFIRSLELICCLESSSSSSRQYSLAQGAITSHRHPRTRPPPLSLNLNNHYVSRSTSPSSPSIAPSLTTQISSSASPFRRARMMIGHSTIPSAFRNSNLGRRLSKLKLSSREGTLEKSDISQIDHEKGPTFSSEPTQSSHLSSLSISSSTWQPPPEWNRVDNVSVQHVSSLRSASPSSSRTPTPLSSRIPSVSAMKHTVPSPVSISYSVHKTKHLPSLPNLRLDKHNSRLSLSLSPGTRSTPSLTLQSFPINASPDSSYLSSSPKMSTRPPPPSFRFEQVAPGSPSIPATPVTPHSAISLSAFPLPPSATSPHSQISGSPLEFLPTPVASTAPYSERSQVATASSVSQQHHNMQFQASSDLGNSPSYLPPSRETTLSPTKVEFEISDMTITVVQPGFIDGLKMGLRELANLEEVIIRYDITGGLPYLSVDQSNLRFNLLRTANQLLVSSLKDIQSLKSIRISCPTDYSSLCSTQLSELKNIFTDVKTSVVATGSL